MMKAGHELIKEGKRSGKWQDAYSSKTIPPIPDDLHNALKTLPIAQRNFQAFPNSTKLMYIHWIINAKKKATRNKRIKQVVKRAEKNIKPS